MPAYSALSASLCVSSSYGMISAQCLPHHPCMRCLLAAGFHEGVSGSPSWSGRSHVIEPYTNFCMYLIAVFIRRFTGMDFSDQRWWHFFHSVSVMAMLRLIASAVEPSVLWRTPRTIWSFWAIFTLTLCPSALVCFICSDWPVRLLIISDCWCFLPFCTALVCSCRMAGFIGQYHFTAPGPGMLESCALRVT